MLTRVLIADRYSAAYANETKFIQSLIDAVNIEWRQAGQKGAALVAASYVEGVGLLDTTAGRSPLTIEEVRAHLRAVAAKRPKSWRSS